MKSNITPKPPGIFLETLRFLGRPFLRKGYWGKPGLRTIANWYRRAYRPEFVMINGHKLYLHLERDVVVTTYLAIHGYWEKMETQMVHRYVKPGMSVLDIGANIGYHTILAAGLVGEKGKVVAIEPGSDNFSLLSRSVAELPFKNVQLVHGAVWHSSGEIQLYVSDDSPSDHRVYDSSEGRHTEPIAAVAIDDLLPGQRFDFLKMDIQGAEGHAFKGMRKTLENHPPTAMVLEFSPGYLATAGTPASEVYAFLMQLGYSTFRIDEEQERVYPISYDQIMAFCGDVEWKFVTLLCAQKGAEPV